MYRWRSTFCMATAMFIAVSSAALGQTLNSISAMPLDTSGLVIRAHAESQKPFTVAGERGVILGQQDGTFEAWVLPVKLLSNLTIEAEIEGYSVPIDVNQLAAEIEVRPDRTIITYAHVGFTVRQIMFSPNDGPGVAGGSSAVAQTGPVVLFEFDCLHPTDFTFRFTPELRWMWPERNEGVPDAEWDSRGGFYILHSDYPDLAGAITIPGAKPGILAPYQERPHVYPVEMKLHIDPVRDHGRLFPLLMAVGTTTATATKAALGTTMTQLNDGIAAGYAAHAERYKKLLANSTSIDTPDKALNEAFEWATVSIEQLRTRVQGTDETALVAGYYSSGDSARPGFGWFFGRDSLYTLYAINGYGDFALSKSELEFLIHRQRGDGKIMHEYSQTAAAIDWQAFPYMYAAADSTPLFLLAVADYVRASGDVGFVAANRDAIEKAWAFETTHDTDGDGIYDNSQGTGWVESWPGGLPHQEIYLALLDQQASAAMGQLETLLKNPEKAAAAHQRADAIGKTIEKEYYDQDKECYAFGRNADGSQDRTSTVYPAMAWWDPEMPNGNTVLAHPEGCLKQFAAHTLNTDWGLRDVSSDEKIYDGMSYHQGSVWPLFTGWAALAEYRGGQPLAGYQLLMENVNLTQAQDLGAVTELLSGDFNIPMGRSTSHQLWSSAMVITPILRGLFGISVDAETKTITVNPHLPAGWDHAEIKNLRVGGESVDLSFVQTGRDVVVSKKSSGLSEIKMRSAASSAKELAAGDKVSMPRHEVEVGSFFEDSLPGERTQSMRIIAEEYGDRTLSLTVEGLAGTDAQIPVLFHPVRGAVRAAGAELSAAGPRVSPDAAVEQRATVHFPAGDGWKTVTVTLSW